MSRYIDIDNFCENFCYCNNEYCDKSSCPILNAPTADVTEVKHGEWITDKDGFVTCSECGEEHTWDDFRPPFCDMCGARMDGGDFDEMPNIKSKE